MSGKKMDRWRAWCVLEFNYPWETIYHDQEWAEEMIEMLTEDSKADKREVCKCHGLKYPPKEYFDWYFKNTDKQLTYADLRRMQAEIDD